MALSLKDAKNKRSNFGLEWIKNKWMRPRLRRVSFCTSDLN